MEWRSRITGDQRVLLGKPVVRGTRVSVELIIELLAGGWSHQQILANYPTLTEDDIKACLAYASHVLQAERLFVPDVA